MYGIDESDVPTDRMIFPSLFPSRKCKKHEPLLYPPPAIHFTFERIFAGVSRGYRYRLDYDLFSKNLARTVSKLSHATAGQVFISRSKFFWVSRPTKEVWEEC